MIQVLCHCLTCRKLSGSTNAMAAMVPEPALKSSGDKARVTYGTHETGMKFDFYGCESCPSTLYKSADGYPGVLFVFLGNLDEDQEGVAGKPTVEMFTKYRVEWLNQLEDSAQFEAFPTQ